MIQLLENSDLANGSRGNTFVFILKANLLHSHQLLGQLMTSLVHHAVSTCVLKEPEKWISKQNECRIVGPNAREPCTYPRQSFQSFDSRPCCWCGEGQMRNEEVRDERKVKTPQAKVKRSSVEVQVAQTVRFSLQTAFCF